MKFYALIVIFFSANVLAGSAGTKDIAPLPVVIKDVAPVTVRQPDNSTTPNVPVKNDDASKSEHKTFIDLGNNKLPVITDSPITKDQQLESLEQLLTNETKTQNPGVNTAVPEVSPVQKAVEPEHNTTSNTSPPLQSPAPHPPVQAQLPKVPASVQELQHPISVVPVIPASAAKPVVNSGSNNNPQAKPALSKVVAPLPKKSNLVINDKHKKLHKNDKVLTQEQSNFVSNEAKVLLLPGDDVVLGKITRQSMLNNMDIKEYLALFNKEQDYVIVAKKRAVIDSFLANYQRNFKLQYPLSDDELGSIDSDAFKAVAKSNLFHLQTLINYYPILQVKDSNGNTLLQSAVINDNYALTKFLLMRRG